MPTIGTTELIIALVVVLILFGPKKLPELARALGKSISEFKGAVEGGEPKKKKSKKEPDA